MKILIINDFKIPVGGVENYLLILLGRAEKKDLEFKLYGKEKEPNFIKKFYNLETKREIRQLIESFNPDLIHAFGIGRVVTPSFMKEAAIKGIPIIVSFRDYHYICPKTYMIDDKGKVVSSHESFFECLFYHMPKYNIFYSILKYAKVLFHTRLINNYANYFLTPSDHLTHWVKKKFPGLDGETLRNPAMLEYSGVDYDFKERKNILYVGRISKEKGLWTAIQSFQGIQDKYKNQKLLIVGEGAVKNQIVNFITTNKINWIELLGWQNREELVRLYSKAKFTVVPSEWMESYGNVVLESFMCKTPVIVSNLGEIENTVRVSKGGLIFKMGSVDDLRDKMRQLLNNPELCASLSNSGYQYAKKLTFEKNISDLKKIYFKVVKSHTQTSIWPGVLTRSGSLER